MSSSVVDAKPAQVVEQVLAAAAEPEVTTESAAVATESATEPVPESTVAHAETAPAPVVASEMPSFLPATEQPGDAAVVAAVEAAGNSEDLAAIKKLEEAEANDPSVAHPTTTTEAVAEKVEEKADAAASPKPKKPAFLTKLFSFISDKANKKKTEEKVHDHHAEGANAPVAETHAAAVEPEHVLPPVAVANEGQAKPLVDPLPAAEPVLESDSAPVIQPVTPVAPIQVETIEAEAQQAPVVDKTEAPFATAAVEAPGPVEAQEHRETEAASPKPNKAEKLSRRLSAKIGHFSSLLKAKSPSKERQDPIQEAESMKATPAVVEESTIAPVPAEKQVEEITPTTVAEPEVPQVNTAPAVVEENKVAPISTAA